MITIYPTAAFLIAMAMMLWMMLAAWLTIRAGRVLHQQAHLLGEHDRVAQLLDASPVALLVLKPNGELTGGHRFVQWLGLERAPTTLSECQRGTLGLTDESLAQLMSETAAAARSGKRFSLPLYVQGGERVLRVEAGPAPFAQGGAGTLILWCFDETTQALERHWLEKESNERADALEALSSLIEAAPFPIWHRNQALKLTLVNTAYVRAVEARDAADVISRDVELVDKASRTDPLAIAREAQEMNVVRYQPAVATIGGQRRSLKIAHVPLGPAGVAAFALDVTDVEMARADLSRFAGAQRAMLDRLSAGVAQFGPDQALRFTNQPMQRIFNLRPDWLAEHPAFDRVLEKMRETDRLPQVRDFPAWKAERRDWFQIAGSANEEGWLLPDGTHLRVVAQPLPDGGLLLIFEDRTEHAQLASARDTLLQVRTATFDNLFESVGVFAADGRLHLWNNRFREAWGMEEEELADHPRIDHLARRIAPHLADPERASDVRELIRSAISDRRHKSGRIAMADGRHFECAAVPLPDGNALFTLLDVTASRAAEQTLMERTATLEEADRIKTAFMSNISYELRTPLTSISGFSEMLASGLAGDLPPAAHDYALAITEAAAKLGALIDDVLDLTQGDAGNLPLSMEEVNIPGLVGQLVGQHRTEAAERGQDFVIEILPGSGSVRGDRRRIRQCVDHLLRNAIQYTQAHGRILLHVDGDAAQARIVVSDNGPGIALEEHEHVFDRFYRARNALHGGGTAAGLGLPLVKHFVEAHGGHLELLSEVGEGTCVTITLPRGSSI
ncbi:ATP-binding protein [Aquisediminimonas sediminicola]|uniref:ATP-binding protein n=1 Tax=Alteraquisediminimonas sediminicola TaxID=2676787 RepID=UPI001FEBFC7C|nr:ATP-binding protein [Aquisediminimonas sediminicola]